MSDNDSSESEEEEGWAKSKAKKLLREGLLAGTITPEMKPKEIFDLAPLVHGKWSYKSWSSNLYRLREGIERDRDRMAKDCLAYGHDLAIVKANRTPGEVPWHRSGCPAKLKEDIAKGEHLEMSPKELWETDEDYKTYTLAVFRVHYFQEIDSIPKREIRFEKKKKRWKYPEYHKDHPRLQKEDEDA